MPNSKVHSHFCRSGFTVMETVAALTILALVCLSVLEVVGRCTASVANSELRMHAFEVARENMENLLVLDSVQEMVEYGTSDRYPDIQWQSVVETFYEPATARMWVRAICSAEYQDTEGQAQTVELTHWLTNLTKKQIIETLKQREKERMANMVFATAQGAAEYLGVDEATVQQWVDSGMRTTADGSFPKNELDLYMQTGGNPTIEDRRRFADAQRGPEQDQPLSRPEAPQTDTTADRATTEDRAPTAGDGELICGYTLEELNQMPFEQVWEILMNWNQ